MKPHEIDQLVPGLGDLTAGGIYTGSRVIANPPPVDTDLDAVVLLRHHVHEGELKTLMFRRGFSSCAGDYEGGEFSAWRRGALNLIFVRTFTEFVRWAAATALGRQLNLKSKEERADLFNTVRGTDDGTFSGAHTVELLERIVK